MHHLDNVLVHMIDKQEAAIFKSNKILIVIKRKFQNISNMQKIGKLYQSYVFILQWHVISFLL